jgi:hypothetical protein
MGDYTAVLRLRRMGFFTKRGRKKVAAWLRKQALHLEKHGAEYGPSFQAKLYFD